MERYNCELIGFSKLDEQFIRRIFSMTDGWLGFGKNIQIVDSLDDLPKSSKNFSISKTSGSIMNNLFPDLKLNGLSVTDRTRVPYRVYIRKENWESLPSRSDYASLREYRVAIINHEVAHVFGYKHVSCKGEGMPSDVRQQPTLSLGGCRPTTKVVMYSELDEWL